HLLPPTAVCLAIRCRLPLPSCLHLQVLRRPAWPPPLADLGSSAVTQEPHGDAHPPPRHDGRGTFPPRQRLCTGTADRPWRALRSLRLRAPHAHRPQWDRQEDEGFCSTSRKGIVQGLDDWSPRFPPPTKYTAS